MTHSTPKIRLSKIDFLTVEQSYFIDAVSSCFALSDGRAVRFWNVLWTLLANLRGSAGGNQLQLLSDRLLLDAGVERAEFEARALYPSERSLAPSSITAFIRSRI